MVCALEFFSLLFQKPRISLMIMIVNIIVTIISTIIIIFIASVVACIGNFGTTSQVRWGRVFEYHKSPGVVPQEPWGRTTRTLGSHHENPGSYPQEPCSRIIWALESYHKSSGALWSLMNTTTLGHYHAYNYTTITNTGFGRSQTICQQ